MKKTIKTLSLIFLLALTVFSCKKKDDDTNDNTPSDTITLKIDNGSKITFSNVTGIILTDKLVMSGQNSDKSIDIIVNSDIDQGTYTNAGQVSINYEENGSTVFTSISATAISFEVTNHDTSSKYIKGDFTLDYYDAQNNSHTVTGTFDVSY